MNKKSAIRGNASMMKRSAIAALFGISRFFFRPVPWVWNLYYGATADIHRIRENGSERFDVIVDAINDRTVHPNSMLDLGCHEGVAFHYILSKCSIPHGVGVDCSEVALSRARELFQGEGEFHVFDLSLLFEGRVSKLPIDRSFDIILASEVLYYLGTPSHHVWRVARRRFDRKQALLRKIQTYSHGIVLLQHFGKRERDAIGKVIESCGGELINREWGLYVLPGLAPKPAT